MTLINTLWMIVGASASVGTVETKYQKLMADPEALKDTITEVRSEDLPLEALTYKDLYRDNISIQQKWEILADLKHKKPEFAKEIYLSCIESTDWLLRVGGLKFLATIDAQMAIERAQKLIATDAALLVRSAAVDVLVELGSITRAKDTLWTALKDKKNFHKGNSLWIRQNIANALQEFSNRSENVLWAEYLEDSDALVRMAAITALEKSNQLQLGNPTDTIDVRSALWKTKLSEDELAVQPIAESESLHKEIQNTHSLIKNKTIKPQNTEEALLTPDTAVYPELERKAFE